MTESSLSLAQVIDAQLTCAAQLAEVLDEEHAALTGATVESLERACGRKATLTQQLQALGNRLQVLAGPRRSSPEFEAWLGRHPDGPLLIERWRALLVQAQRLAEQNRRNGVLLDARERQVKDALLALAPEPPPIYGRNGYRPNLPTGRVYSRA